MNVERTQIEVRDLLIEAEPVVQQYEEELAAARSAIAGAIAKMEAIQRLRDLVSLAMVGDRGLLSLMNSPLGFATDRAPTRKNPAPQPYDNATIRDCIVAAILAGAVPLNNEICIISGKCYLQRSFFERATREWPGCDALEISIGVPEITHAGALVPARARWRQNGELREVDCNRGSEFDARIYVRPGDGERPDVEATIGKATRKLLARVLTTMTGMRYEDADPDDAIAERVTPQALPSAVPAHLPLSLDTHFVAQPAEREQAKSDPAKNEPNAESARPATRRPSVKQPATITEAQGKTFWGAAMAAGKSKEQIQRWLADHGVAATLDMPVEMLDSAIAWAKS